jgi:anaerobic magnesium-protoporphyrin IX monomethyl ester cyclase
LTPDLVGATAITPAIHGAEVVLKLAKEICPGAVTVRGGIHGAFMDPQVVTEAPWIERDTEIRLTICQERLTVGIDRPS